MGRVDLAFLQNASELHTQQPATTLFCTPMTHARARKSIGQSPFFLPPPFSSSSSILAIKRQSWLASELG